MVNRLTLFPGFIRKQLVLASQSVHHPVFANSMALLLIRGATTGTRFVVLLLVARATLPVQFGLVAFTLSIVEIARNIADFGIDLLTVREFAITKQFEAVQSFASLVSFSKLINGFVGYVAVIIFFLFQQDYAQIPLIMVMGILIITSLGSNLAVDYFQAQLRVSNILVPILGMNIITVILVGLLVWFKASLLATIAILPLAEMLTLIILLRALNIEVPLTTSNWKWQSFIKLLAKSTPLAVTTVLVTLYTRMDVVVLNSFLGTAAVGYYGIAFRLTEPFQLIALSFATSIYSHISVTLATNKKAIRQLVSRYLLAVSLYGLVSCIVLALLAPYTIHFVLPRYMPSVPILQFLAVALIFRTVNTSLTSLVQAYGYFSQITLVATWNLVFISLALLFFVPRMGAPGAALALLAGEISNTIIQGWLVKRAMSTTSEVKTTVEI